MAIPLSAYGRAHRVAAPIVGKIVSPGCAEWPRRILAFERWREDVDTGGVDAVLCAELLAPELLARTSVPIVHGLSLQHLAEGDIVSLDPRGHVRTVYRRRSSHNALFATDRCNSLCLMCSQPPRVVDDDWRVREMLDIIELIDPSTPALGITGGEPTLLKDGFLTVVRACRDRLPATALHVLSNGRLFRYGGFARALATIAHPDLTVGIPIYSDIDAEHDHIVQARGAFDDTMIGLQNLARHGVAVEIRVVVHRLTYGRLPQLAEFIYRNLTFSSHVALMGLEITGYAIPHLEMLWIDPYDYGRQLEAATLFLADRGVSVSIYNHQLCTVPESVWPYCRKSISDWKNEYLDLCDGCAVRDRCGGLFTSVAHRRRSAHLRPVAAACPADLPVA